MKKYNQNKNSFSTYQSDGSDIYIQSPKRDITSKIATKYSNLINTRDFPNSHKIDPSKNKNFNNQEEKIILQDLYNENQ